MTGYSVPAHQCGDYSLPIFYNNVAHSVSGNGAQIWIHPADPTQSTCLEASNFVAYKCSQTGATSYAATQQAIFSFMTLIDNNVGVALNIG